MQSNSNPDLRFHQVIQRCLQKVSASPLWLFPFLILLFGLVSFALMKPGVGWDLLGYTGSALKMLGKENVHSETYSLVQQAVPEHFEALTTDNPLERESTYRSTMYADPAAFEQQLAYYQIRPLYTAFLAVGYTIGLSPVDVMIWLSMISGIVLGLLVYKRLERAMAPLMACIFSLGLMLLLRLPAFAGITTVDPLIACGFVAFVFTFEKGLQFKGVLAFCLILVLLRSNAVVFTFPILAIGVCSYYLQLPTTRLSPVQAAVIGAASIILMKIIELSVGNYGWWTVFYFTFVESMNFPAQFAGSFDLAAYLEVVVREGRWLLSDRGATAFYIFLSVVLYHFLYSQWHAEKTMIALIMIALLVIFVGHFLLFPAVFLRFFFPLYLLGGVYAAVCLSAHLAVPAAVSFQGEK